MKKVLLVFGTRPEAIKMCPLVLAIKKSKVLECKVCVTGQHREMLDQVMEIFGIKADYDLNIMKQNQTLSMITNSIILNIEKIYEKENPDIVLVHGDTTTAFAAALTAFYHNILVGHVEAGLRTYNMESPFPEEFNRQAVDLVSGFYFAPTKMAQKNLLNEGKDSDNVFVTGNTVIDALKTTVNCDYTDANIEWVGNNRLILFTAHRRENFGIPMQQMFRAIRRIALEYPDVRVIYPVHKNPKVSNLAQKMLGECETIRLIEPLDVDAFHNYINKSYMILTDSGGVQEEAPSLGKPVLVMRETTERPEGVEAGTLKLIGTDENNIYYETKGLLEDMDAYNKMSCAINPYGDGHASERIVNILEDRL